MLEYTSEMKLSRLFVEIFLSPVCLFLDVDIQKLLDHCNDHLPAYLSQSQHRSRLAFESSLHNFSFISKQSCEKWKDGTMTSSFTFACISDLIVIDDFILSHHVSLWKLGSVAYFLIEKPPTDLKHTTLVTVAVTDGAETLHSSFHLPVFSNDFSSHLPA